MQETDLDFYATAAQVIPLVFITLAIDLRGFVISPLDRLLPSWNAIRGEHQPKLIKADVEQQVAAKRLALQRELSPEEFFEIFARVTKDTTESWDGTEDSLKEKLRLGRFIAAGSSLGAMLALIFGEAIALRVLEVGHATRVSSGIVESALWLGAGLLTWRLAERVLDTVSGDSVWLDAHRNFAAFLSAGILLAATYVGWHSF